MCLLSLPDVLFEVLLKPMTFRVTLIGFLCNLVVNHEVYGFLKPMIYNKI